LWAQSFLYAKAPDFVVEKWLGEKPETEGKFILVEFWATWCSACRRAQPLMNALQDKFGDELIIVGVSDESSEKVLPYIKENNIEYHMAVDPMARMKDALGVWGIPHVIIIEPGGYVIWEGFPLLEGYELTEQTIQRILEIGRSQKS
jgi:thiol-disulfide isomerase/thioredoxin